jgi:NADPH:quinone reductase-like Zn-dependent oxidoreductase
VNAIRLREPSGVSGLAYEEVPDARPGLGDVLVKVAARGITPGGARLAGLDLPGRAPAGLGDPRMALRP